MAAAAIPAPLSPADLALLALQGDGNDPLAKASHEATAQPPSKTLPQFEVSLQVAGPGGIHAHQAPQPGHIHAERVAPDEAALLREFDALELCSESRGSDGQRYEDRIIDGSHNEEPNRPKFKAAIKDLWIQLKREGKMFRAIYPKLLRVDWIDAEGKAGSTEICSNDPCVRELRRIYATDIDPHEKKPRHDISTWPFRTPGHRGDQNGKVPLQLDTKFLQQHYTKTRPFNELEREATAPDAALANKLPILRRLVTWDNQIESLHRMIAARRAVLDGVKAPQDVAQIRNGLDALERELTGLNHYAAKLSLYCPLTAYIDPQAPITQEEIDQVYRIYERERKGIGEELASEKGKPLDQAEKEYVHDAVCLSLVVPGDEARERIFYKHICERSGMRQSQDAMESVLIRSILAIENPRFPDPGRVLAECQPIRDILLKLPAEEQMAIQTEIRNYAVQRREALDRLTQMPPPARKGPQKAEIERVRDALRHSMNDKNK